MKWLLAIMLLALVLPAHAAHEKPAEPALLRTVDMMRPVMRNADSFGTAQRMARNDLEAFLKTPNNATYTRLNASLDRLGEIAGYTDPYVCRSKVRSAVSYRHVRRYVDDMAMKPRQVFYCKPRQYSS